MAKYPVKLLKDKDGTAFIPVVNSDSIITPEGDTLNDLLEEKQDLLTSGTNIKTINNESLLGSGNISIQGGGSGGTSTDVKINGTSITSGDTANIAVEGTYNASTNKLMTKSEVDGYDASWIYTSTPSVADFNAFYNYVDNGGIRVYVTSQYDDQINTELVEGVEIREWGDEKYISIYSVGDLLHLICDGTQVTKKDVQLFERSYNKVTSLSSSSSDNQYPSAKCVYDNLNKIENQLETNDKKLSQVITGNATVNSTYIKYAENNAWERIGKVVVYHFTLAVTGTWDNTTKFLTNLPKPISYTRFIALDTSSNEPIRVGINTDGSASNAWSAVTPISGHIIEGLVTYITSD